VSIDDRETLTKFKNSLKAPFPFVPDPKGEMARLYHVKTPVVSLALRYTLVIGPGRKILRVDHGKDAINPETAIRSCAVPARANPAAP
jgi:peroxiredoxin Q/BCP